MMMLRLSLEEEEVGEVRSVEQLGTTLSVSLRIGGCIIAGMCKAYYERV